MTAKTRRKPSPLRMYCSRIALNSSCPAVSSTVNKTNTPRRQFKIINGVSKHARSVCERLDCFCILTVEFCWNVVDDALLRVRILDRWIIVGHEVALKKNTHTHTQKNAFEQ